MAKMQCHCSIYCPYCGRHRSLDSVGHYCQTRNCQYEHGFSNCLRPTRDSAPVLVAKESSNAALIGSRSESDAASS